MFRETCFGPYLDLKETLIQAQLIHQLLLRQVNLMITAPKSLVGDESSSKLKKKKIRYSESNEDILKRLAEIEVKLQSNEEILKRPAEIEAKVESNDIILKRLTDIESKIQSNEEIQNRLAELEMKVQSNIQIEKQIKELEEKVQSNEKILERVANVESKVNDLQKLKNDAENVANDTMDLKKNLTDCPSFSLDIEFDMTGKSIEGLAETSSIDEDIINFNEEDWKIVDDVAAHSLTDDEVTTDAPLKRQKKPAALLQSLWVNQYDSAVGISTVGTSTVRTTKRVLKGTSAFKVGLFSPCGSDVEAFESWYKQGLVTKKNGDCEIYVIKYAEYFINLKKMPKTFNIAQVRKHLATQLYVYAKRKQVENYDTDNDWVPKDV
ncbi:Uncharacterized protein Adt_23436 [Abeliophyllum distichum]|uniref:Uncharacterized protein n=1 Tax=Abeliophyllum distichum TaxID=126358 RepID=A0ABD1SAV5_9LAMI